MSRDAATASLDPPRPAAEAAERQPGRAGARRRRDEWRAARGSYPPGPSDFSIGRTQQVAHDPLPLLLGALRRVRADLQHAPAAHAGSSSCSGRRRTTSSPSPTRRTSTGASGSFGDLIPLLGDGLLTIDDAYHDRARAIMMPAFHREQIAASVGGDGRPRPTRRSRRLPPGEIVDVYEWMRNLAMRIAMRALLGLDPDEAGKGAAAAEHFERALGFYGIDFHLRLLRGPGSPWRRWSPRARCSTRSSSARSPGAAPTPTPARMDILSLLLGVRDEAGEGFSDKEVRDQVMTLMFAGHDTSTSTLTFMMHELARHPDVLARLQRGAGPGARRRRPRHRPARARDALPRHGPRRGAAALPAGLDRAAPRRARLRVRRLQVTRGAYVNYCSWASHRIPEVFPDPEAFIPERFTRERKAALPRGAYVPFGGGWRICIGKRFGQTEVKLVATMLLQRLRLDALPGRTMTIRQMPTLSPRAAGGSPCQTLANRAALSGVASVLAAADGAGPTSRADPAEAPTAPLLDEEHLLVLRQRPEVVGDDLLQLVGRLADLGHRGDLLVAGVDRQLQALEAGSALAASSSPRASTSSSTRPRTSPSIAETPASPISARWRSAAGRIIVLAIEKVVSASMLARIAVLLDPDLVAGLELALGEHARSSRRRRRSGR